MNNTPHLIVFLNVPDRANPAAVAIYARRFFASHQRDSPAAAVADSLEKLTCVDLPLVDREQCLRSLPPETVARLQQQERCLLDQVAWAKDGTPEGETLVRSYASVLAAAHGPCPPGTVVVIRETNVATVAFLYPHLQIDSATGTLSDVANPLQTRRRLDRVTPPPLLGAAVGDSPPDWVPPDWVHYGLATAGTLSFALPEPFGVIFSAGFNLIDMLLPGEKEDPFANLSKLMDNRDWGNWLQFTKDLVTWIEVRNKALRDQNPSAYTVEKELLDPLTACLTPLTSTSLSSILFEAANQQHLIDEPEKFYALLTCVNSYLFGMKYKIVFLAYISGSAEQEEDLTKFNNFNDRWRFDYKTWVLDILGSGGNIEGWVPKISKLIDDRIAARLAKIHPPTRTDIHTVDLPLDPLSNPVITDIHMWQWWDDETGESHRYDDEVPKNAPKINREQDARREHGAHVADVSAKLDAQYRDAKKMVAQWRDSINQWNNNLPPDKPTGTPTIDPESFRKVTAADGPWMDPNNDEVMYAVSFYNDKSGKANRPGPISDWVKARIDGQCCPTLVNVPIDTYKMATGRRIYRKFGKNAERFLGTIPDNTTTSYKDIDVKKR